MPQFTVKLIAALALAGVSLGEVHSASAQAQSEGEVNITDSPPQEPITESEPLPVPGEAGTEDSTEALPSGAAYSMAGYPGMNAPYLPGGGTPIQRKNWYGYQNQGPWMRPIKRPLYRVPVQYARYWPTSYYTGGYDPLARYGHPLPMIYQPTDTTQLGFYHQRVPQWQPRPGAIPGPPWPPNWHYAIPTQIGEYQGGWSGQDLGYDPNAGYGYAPGYSEGYSGMVMPEEVNGEDRTTPDDSEPSPLAPPPTDTEDQ